MRIAITGGIAEGKSTVVRMLQEHGLTSENSDSIARRVFLEQDVQRQLGKLAGSKTHVTPDELREAIALRPDLRRQVNRIMHPRILEVLEASRADVFEVPLLLEACIQGRFNRVWVVTCGPEEQLRRLSARLGDPQSARRLIEAQLPSSVKLAFSDETIRTNLPMEIVKNNVLDAIGRELA
jgi:dephospho-CoA kinase